MISEEILSWVNEYGYLAFFLLGFVGTSFTPIPDPVLFFSSGYFSYQSDLIPWLTFGLAYIGFMLSLYIKFLLGLIFSVKASNYLSKKKKFHKHIIKSEHLIKKYGGISIIIAYFLPIVRHVLPIILGIMKYSHLKYVSILFSSGFLWTAAVFIIGFLWQN